MRLQSVFSAFTRRMSNASTPQNAQQSSVSAGARNTHNGSLDSCESHEFKLCRSDAIRLCDLTPYLSRTLINSDLGDWDQTYPLRFSHFLAEDPSIAVFSESQHAPVPAAWRHHQARGPWRINIRCRWLKGRIQVRSPCAVRVTVGSWWEYKISLHAVRYWSASDRMLLVDWGALYGDYFAQDRKDLHRERADDMVKRFRRLEERALVRETGGQWSSYGDWGIHQPTSADVALACRYESHSFENGLGSIQGEHGSS
jgi:hypothetical protein